MTPLSSINQIRFPGVEGPFGYYVLIINRPGTLGVTTSNPTVDTLTLIRATDSSNPFRVSPYILGDLPLSKKFTTTVGRRALDDMPIAIRDSIGYTGTVNGVVQSEQFDASYMTVFDTWFQGKLPYQALILSVNFTATGNVTEVSHMGYVDPTYNPSTDPIVYNPGTANQIWVGTRTVKVTAMSQAQLGITWGNVLAPYDATYNPNVPASYAGITSADCKTGNAYNGFMVAPPGTNGAANSRSNIFGSSPGYWYQAVPHIHLYSLANSAYLVSLPAAAWPSNAFSASFDPTAILLLSFNSLGSGYAVGDTGTINGGTIHATYKVLAIGGGGFISSFQLTYGGSGYAIASSVGTATGGAQPGVGSGLNVNIVKLGSTSSWGPSGLVFISLKTLFQKISLAMGLSAFGSLASALDFFLQKALNSGSQRCFPLDTSALPLDELYISLNVFAQSHPYDGSLWGNPGGFAPSTAIMDVITGVCNFLLADFNESYSVAGAETLKLTSMGDTSGGVPASWQFIGAPAIEDPSTMATNAVVNNRGDSLKIQCPVSDKGQSSAIEIPIRLHRIGATGGNSLVPDTESATWDGSDIGVQADNCFKVAWLDASGVPTINSDCWKGLCYLYWFDSAGTAAVYPSNWDPFVKNDGTAGSWTNVFYVVNACFKSGGTPNADLLAQPNGDGYFNSRDYHSVAFAALTLASGTIQTFQYAGISDDSGSVQAIRPGIPGTWRLGTNGSQHWRGIQVDQAPLGGTTTIKWQAVSGTDAFPNLTDLIYGPVGGTGGTSSTTGGNTSTGGNPNGNNPTGVWSTATNSLTASTNNLSVALTTPNVYLQLSATSAYDLTGIIPSPNCVFLKIRNTGTNVVTLQNLNAGSTAANQFSIAGGDFPLLPGQTAEFIYDSLWVCCGTY